MLLFVSLGKFTILSETLFRKLVLAQTLHIINNFVIQRVHNGNQVINVDSQREARHRFGYNHKTSNKSTWNNNYR